MFLDRTPRKDDPWLGFKVGAFSLGAVLAFAGIYLRWRWLIWAAIGVLLLGFAVRFLDEDDEADGEASSPEAAEPEARETDRESSPRSG